jgi:sortase A
VLRVANSNPIPVFAGVNPSNLNRGAAWIPGTARPGDLGGVAIAGDNERYFHGLRDVIVGDSIELFTNTTARSYVVDGIAIIQRGDIGILQDRGSPSITLVTGYPVDFVGDAPMWLTVHGTLTSPDTFGIRVLAMNRTQRVPL